MDSGKAGGIANKKRYDEAYELAMQGRIDEIDKELLTKYYSTYKKVAADHQPKHATLDDKTTAVFIYGPTGTGKSRYARETYFPHYCKTLDDKWFDGYEGEPYIIIDDIHRN